MSKAAHFTYLSSDGTTKIHAVEWTGDGPVIGVLQIVHGMQEFIERYDHFARWMADQGFAVFPEYLLVVLPDRGVELAVRLQNGLEMEMKVPDGKQTHETAPLLPITV